MQQQIYKDTKVIITFSKTDNFLLILQTTLHCFLRFRSILYMFLQTKAS